MQVRAGYEISIRCEQETPLIAYLSVHPSRVPDLLSSDSIRTNIDKPLWSFTDAFGNRGLRTTVPAGTLSLEADFLIEDPELPARVAPDVLEAPIEQLPDDILPYLLGSRYCETDKLLPVAWSLFGDTARGAPRVEAIVGYVRERIQFGYEYASSTLSAWEVHSRRRGVCRDFVHLAVAFCRCMNIPARYCSGYLPRSSGDSDESPTDFAAWMEAYVGGRWYTLDPGHASPHVGSIAVAYGRDAADVALYTTFGASTLERFHVFTYAV